VFIFQTLHKYLASRFLSSIPYLTIFSLALAFLFVLLGCPKIINLGTAKSDNFYERKRAAGTKKT